MNVLAYARVCMLNRGAETLGTARIGPLKIYRYLLTIAIVGLILWPTITTARVAATLTNIGWLYFKQSRYADGEPLAQRALQILEAQFGPNHPALVGNLVNYAALLRKLGRDADAQRFADRAKAIKSQ